MEENVIRLDSILEKRSQPRSDADAIHSVEINLKGSVPIYQFKLRDVSVDGACILVKEDSPILDHIKVGQVMDMRYYYGDRSNPSNVFKTEIRRIAKPQEKGVTGHYQVGVAILEKP